MPLRNVKRSGWTKWLPRSVKQVGRRGTALLMLGVLWLLLGCSAFLDMDVPTAAPAGVFHLLLPADVRGLLWMLTGGIAICGAFRPPGFSDAFGWTALYAMPAILMTSYLSSWLDWVVPFGTAGYERGWVPAITWAVIVVLVATCAGWPEPARVPLLTDEQED